MRTAAMASAAGRRSRIARWRRLALRLPCILAILTRLQPVAALPRHSRWTVARSGVVELVANPELRLNVKGGGLEKGDPLILWPCSAQSHEVWDVDRGAIKLRQNPLLCLNAEGGARSGARIITWPCSHMGTPEPNEEFLLGQDGRIRLIDHPSLCISVKGGLVELGAGLVLGKCGKLASHTHDVFVHHDGVLQLKADRAFHFNAMGGDLLNSSPVVLWKCEPAMHEVFEFTWPDNRIRLKQKPEMCVNAEGGLGQGNRLIIWPCAPISEVNERFVYDKERQVIHPQAVRTLAFNVKGGDLQNGGEIVLWTTDESEL